MLNSNKNKGKKNSKDIIDVGSLKKFFVTLQKYVWKFSKNNFRDFNTVSFLKSALWAFNLFSRFGVEILKHLYV